VSCIPQTVSREFTVVQTDAEEVLLIEIVSPLFTFHELEVYVDEPFFEYSHPQLIPIGVEVFIHDIVIIPDIY
jgi:hypothetical protein